MRWITILLYIFSPSLLYAQLLINEIACNVAKSDWVELFFSSSQSLSMDISMLYVTMYYGTNEPLSQNPVTIYSYDKPETPWDDRFVVVHLTDPITPDECDMTGDTNGNGVLDVYCNNYVNSLWNTDCVVAIDTDDEPSNGGIIDFVAYSNRDGTLNASISQYVSYAIQQHQWTGDILEEHFVDIGTKGLLEYQSIIRKNVNDTNSLNDFLITSFQTPGRPNIIPVINFSKDLIKINKKIVINKKYFQPANILVLHPCKFRIRLFSSIGKKIYETPLIETMPCVYPLNWSDILNHVNYGLYLGILEAENSYTQQKTEFFCIIIQ